MNAKYVIESNEKFHAMLNRTASRLGGKTLANTILHAVCVGSAMIQAEKDLGLSIILRDSGGNEWSFSIENPGKSSPIHSREPPRQKPETRAEDNVIYVKFGKD